MTALLAVIKQNTQLTVLVVVALGMLILNPFFYLGYQSAEQQIEDLGQDEMMAGLQLANTQSSYDVENLEQQRDDLRDEIALLSQGDVFAETVPSAQLNSTLANVAGWNGVSLLSLSSTIKPATEKIGDTTYQKTVVTVGVSGTLANLRAFLTAMEDGSTAGLRFEDVRLTATGQGSQWEGQLALSVLSQA
jgi:hypothetical protein